MTKIREMTVNQMNMIVALQIRGVSAHKSHSSRLDLKVTWSKAENHLKHEG